MNLALIFNALFSIELLLIVFITIVRWRGLLASWKTSLAGYFGIAITLFIQGLYYSRTGQLHDLVGTVQFLACGIALLVTDDYKPAPSVVEKCNDDASVLRAGFHFSVALFVLIVVALGLALWITKPGH